MSARADRLKVLIDAIEREYDSAAAFDPAMRPAARPLAQACLAALGGEGDPSRLSAVVTYCREGIEAEKPANGDLRKLGVIAVLSDIFDLAGGVR